MTAILRDHPTFSLGARVQLWIADARAQREEWDLALAAYREVHARWPRSGEAVEAGIGIGDVAMKRRRWGEALAAYRAIGSIPAARAFDVESLVAVAREQRTRSWVARVGGAYALAFLVFLFAGTRWAEVGRPGFRSPGRELSVLVLPVAAILVLGRGEHPIIFRSLLTANLLYLVLAVGNALFVETRRLSRRAGVLHGAALVVASVAILYSACYLHGLHLLLEETMRTGPD